MELQLQSALPTEKPPLTLQSKTLPCHTMTFTGSDDGDVDAGIAKVKKFKLKLTN